MKNKKASSKKDSDKRPAVSSQISPANFPALRQFLRGYLHQDWQEEYDSPEEAAQQFCDDASPRERHDVAREWEAFHRQTKNLSLPAVSAVLSDQLGAAWAPQAASHLEAISAIFRPFSSKT